MASASLAKIRKDMSWTIFSVAFFGSMSSTGFGFDQGWWSGALSFQSFAEVFGVYDATTDSWSLTTKQQSVGTGVGILAVVVGLVLGTVLSEKLGRWKTFLIQALILLVGIIIEATCFTSWAQLVVGRTVVYIAGGIATNLVPAYQVECAPPSLRGLMATCYNGCLMLGALVSALILYLCRNVPSHWSWRGVVVAQIASPLICLLGLFTVLPESPRWLIMKDRPEEAAAALRRLRSNDQEADLEFESLRQSLAEEERVQRLGSYVDCFKGTNFRRTIIVIGIQVLQQAQGTSFIGNYLGVFMIQIGFSNSLLIVLLSYIIGLVANVIAMFTIDLTGRRRVLFISAMILAVFMFIIGGLTAHGSSALSPSVRNAVVAFILIWFSVFQVTWGPLAWVTTGEVPTAVVRDKSITISAASTYAVNCVITFVNPYVQDAISGRIGFIYGAFSVIAAVFVFVFVPELKQRSLEEIDELFEKKLPARQFSSYICSGPVTKVAVSVEEKPTDTEISD